MNELEEALTGESYAAAPAKIIEGLPDALAHRQISDAPRTLYAELWHIAFWQQMSLDWMRGLETPYPATPELPFPSPADISREPWDQLRARFLRTSEKQPPSHATSPRSINPSTASRAPARQRAPCPSAIN
jgi:hypothetical protein